MAKWSCAAKEMERQQLPSHPVGGGEGDYRVWVISQHMDQMLLVPSNSFPTHSVCWDAALNRHGRHSARVATLQRETSMFDAD